MAVVEQESFGDIYRADDLALFCAHEERLYGLQLLRQQKNAGQRCHPEGTPVNYYLLQARKNNPYLKAEVELADRPAGLRTIITLRQRLADASIPD